METYLLLNHFNNINDQYLYKKIKILISKNRFKILKIYKIHLNYKIYSSWQKIDQIYMIKMWLLKIVIVNRQII
jgi:hypothetical protein